MQSFNRILLFILFSTFQVIASDSWQISKLEKVNQYRILNGEIEAVNKATVSAQTAGRVEKINYDIDDFVNKDSIIVEFTNTEQKSRLNQALDNAKAAEIAYLQAQTDYKRVKEIFEKKLVAKSQLDTALSNRDALKAKYTAAESGVVAAKKQFEYTIIRAPYDGIVTKRFVEIGEIVNPGTPIMEGLSLSQLRVVTNIPETIVNKIKNKPEAIIVLNNGKEIQSNKMTIFPYADSLTRTFKSRIDFDTIDTQLFPGMTVNVKFKIGEKEVILIPKSSIIRRNELNLVYVIKGEKILPRQVRLGSQYNESIEVLSGINVDEKFLISPIN